MEIPEGHIRHILLFYFRKGKNAAQVHWKLCVVYGDEYLRVGSIPTVYLKILNNCSGQWFDGKSEEKRSGKRNRDTLATVLFLFRSVTPVPRKLDQIILFLSPSRTCDSSGGTPSVISLALSKRQFQNWFARFRSGNFNVKGEPRPGRPIAEKVDEILKKIELDISSRDIAMVLNIDLQ